MVDNEMYAALDRLTTENERLNKKLSTTEKKLSAMFSEQTIKFAKLNDAQALVRNSLSIAQEVERAALVTEQALATIQLFGRADSTSDEMLSLKAEQTKFMDKLILAQAAAKKTLEVAQLAARVALDLESTLANAITLTGIANE